MLKMQSAAVVTKEFLEKAIGKQIESFTAKAQADTGNNFMSVIYTFDVNLISSQKENGKESSVETVHYICKCYPSNPARQDFLNEQNIFWKELAFYKDWMPELQKFQLDLGIEEIVKPDFPELVAGETVDFNNKSVGKEDTNNNPSKKIYQPFDHYVMMVDLCKTKGFKLPDRLLGLDRDHVLVAMDAYAKIHALSWAYKTHKKIDEIKKLFPFEFDYTAGDTKKTMDTMTVSCVEEAIRSLESSGGCHGIIAALSAFKDKIAEVMSIGFDAERDIENELHQFYRVKPSKFLDTDIPWRVIIHGDAHLNNMLFHYNPETGKPDEVVLIDLQICRETCPLIDIVNLIYSSTDTTFRDSHVDEMMEVYCKRFTHYCDLLKTETLPGFSVEEVNRRYDRLKIYGFGMNMMASAMLLKERSETVQMDSLTGMDQGEMMASLFTGMSSNKKYNDRISALVNEGISQGII